ncbi:MAG: Hpt domain-containing protein [Planctomycetes bacterium]|nr:Hpt domain-containing protein [Planctomycetota bacterium]
MSHVPPSQVLDLNVVQALRDLGGDDEPGLFDEVVELFLTDAQTNVSKLSAAFAASDAKELQRVAHSLKSSAANVGAMHLSKLSFEVEKLGRAGTCEGAGPWVEQIRTHFQDVSAALAAMRGGSD